MNVMNIPMRCLLTALLLGVGTGAGAQLELRTEAQLSASGGDHTPLWLNANKYGLSSLDRTNGYVRAGLFRPLQLDSARRWGWGAGADVAVAGGFTSTLVVQQAYGELRWLKGLLTVGSKEQPMELHNQALSSGPQTLGVNARPVPGVRLAMPVYWDVPGLRGWLGLKGHLFYGLTTDDHWQRDFSHRASTYTEHTMLHTKAGYLRIGPADKPFTAEMGMEMGCQFGGKSHYLSPDGMVTYENSGGLKGMLRAFVPSGGEAIEDGTVYRNTEGNHVGSYVVRLNLDYDRWGASVYADHFFEDQSSMFLLDYDGYGSGDRWNDRVDSRYFRYDLRDMMLGAEVRLKQCPWVSTIVVEYLYTKYQCGPIYHDHTQLISDHLAGTDNYYNHYLFSGWQHWGQVMGNPLYRSPLYNDDATIEVNNNRFWAWHLGIGGSPVKGLRYRLLCTIQRGWGTYYKPLDDPARNFSLMGEAEYCFPRQSKLQGWSVKGAVGMDRGALLGDNTGVQLTIGKRLTLGNK